MRHITGIPRQQLVLFPESLDEYISADNPVRFIDAFVDSLDDEHIIEETQQRVEAYPEIMQQRKELVEHPFGTIKHWWDQGHFLTKGLEKVRAEFSLPTLAYNIRRVLNILGVERLLAALRGPEKLFFSLFGVQTSLQRRASV
jgi:hypothetical protein